ncbi:hypothetical protein [Wohlfahrtiimonas chitiniclastica]|uniref:hypothetical protein n=1 Tax=Wohlfahrtiimonas chitiniclastica TaxID=400946 RepID=UPI001BD086E9|nr:hypothetical protein [Wohlfahrtiimonas chitiniclastica]MBS7837189.1 hypothetical protein [Wohlfahrtiimonas chitiniclastica]
MKKLTEKIKLSFIIANRRELKKRKHDKEYKALSSKKYHEVIVHIANSISLVSQNHHNNLCKAIEKIKKHASSNINTRIILDFSAVTLIDTSGMILLYSELDVINQLKKKTHFKIKPPIDAKCADVLVQLEFYQMLGVVGKREIRTQHRDVIHWKFIRGTSIEDFGRWKELGIENTKIYRCASEAVENATYHGYLTDRNDIFNSSSIDKTVKRWWMFAEVIDNVLSVAIADLGIGFSGSLNEMIKRDSGLENTVKLILRMFRKEKYLEDGVLHFKNESDLIRRVVESTDTITRTGKTNRGKGLPAICDIVRRTPNSRLHIWSNTGSYELRNKVICASQDKNDIISTPYSYKCSIKGTVLCWGIPLEV